MLMNLYERVLTMYNLQREVWEGWTVKDFILEVEPLVDMVMNRESFMEPFTTRREMIDFIRQCQPYYKKAIPEVNAYFVKKYGLS